jgi:hypothetical protein
MDVRVQPSESISSAKPIKRSIAVELEGESDPTAKRAKRSKHGKKKRSKDKQGSDAQIVQDDWICFKTSPVTGDPMAPITSPKSDLPNPFQVAGKAQAPKASKESVGEPSHKDEDQVMEVDQDETPSRKASHKSQKAEANTRKSRARKDLKRALEEADAKVASDNNPLTTQMGEKKLESDPFVGNGFTFGTQTSRGNIPPLLNDTSKEAGSHDDDLSDEERITPSSAGLKTLKSINKHLKSLGGKLVAESDQSLAQEIQSIHNNTAQIHQRLESDALRAAIRHEILFNALKKVSTDINRLSHQFQLQSQGQGHMDETAVPLPAASDNTTVAATPRSSKGARENDCNTNKGKKTGAGGIPSSNGASQAMQQSRKTLERCLSGFTEDMNKAKTVQEVSKYGMLCVQYAGDLFKTLG